MNKSPASEPKLTQAKSILIDPFANFFQKNAEGSDSSPKKKKKSQKPAKDVNTSESTVDDSPKKKRKKLSTSPRPSQSNNVKSKPKAKQTKKSAEQPSISLINTPPPTPPRTDVNVPIIGDIPIFTDKFLEHNRQVETELKRVRKMNTDYEQQNAVLEKHVENVQAGISKTNAQIKDLKEENEKLESYLNTLRQKLAMQLRNLSIPSQPNGASIENIDKYMADLHEMAKDNSHGPASLNKAKDLLRKVDLNIDLTALHKTSNN